MSKTRVKDPQTKKWVVKESDGIVLAESAMDLPCRTHKEVRIYPNEGKNVTNKGSSHMQVRNDEGIKEHLFNLFEGDYGKFFETKVEE